MRVFKLTLILALLPAAAPATVWAQGGGYGGSVAIGTDEILVGEPNNSFRPGGVYVYRRSGVEWQQAARLESPSPERGDGFGAGVTLAGSRLFVIGDEGIHVYGRTGAEWRHEAVIEAPADATPAMQFGASMAASGDWLLVGAPAAGGGGRRAQQQQRSPGAIYAFSRGANGTWSASTRITAAERAAGDAFGSAIDFIDDRVLVGAPGAHEGAGEVHVISPGEWRSVAVFRPEAGEPGDAFGSTIDARTRARVANRSDDGNDLALIGAPGSGDGSGGGYLFIRNGRSDRWQEWTPLAATGTPADRLGSAVALDGNDILLGAPMGRGPATGWVQVFRLGGADWQAAQRITPDTTDPGDAFGTTIVARDGIVAVGATGMDHGAGSVFVFERDASNAWQQRALLKSPPDVLAKVTGGEVKCGEDGTAELFPCGDVELLSMLSPTDVSLDGRGTRMNDIWGWTDPQTGREYALAGRVDATAFIDITDPVNPVFLGELPQTPGGPPSPTWRDIKVYRDHAYIVADAAGAHGMQVFDLTQLRNVRNAPVRFEPTARYTEMNSAHNIVINEETGFAYSVGSSAGGETCGGGLHMIDIREPANPKFAGCFADPQTGRASTGYSHDAQCVVYRGPDERFTGHEICLGSNENSLSIADVTDKQNPVALSRAAYPNPGYTHQGWLTDDQRYFFMNDEGDELAGTVERTRTIVWDLARLDDPKLHTEFMGTTSASDHNLYVRGNLMYQSNYRAGLRIIDISDPGNPVEVGYFDTAPYLPDEPGFSGTWSNYPFFPSGTVIVSSSREGLFVVKKRDTGVVF
ncbi:MAG: choice-of-anchor B family protein [Gemmatimonadota bacterium]